MSPAAGRLADLSMLRLAHSTMKYGAETSAPCAAGPAELLRPSLAAAEALNGASRCCACWRPSGPATDRPHRLDRSDSDRLRSGHASSAPGCVLRHFEPVPEDHGEEQTDEPHANHDQAGFRDIRLFILGKAAIRHASPLTRLAKLATRRDSCSDSAKAMRTYEKFQKLQRMLRSAAHRSSRAPTISCDLFDSRGPAASRSSSQVANERRWTMCPS